MTMLLLASLSFALMHLLVSGTALRGAIVARTGERPYRAAFSLASALVLGWMIWAYGQARTVELSASPGLRHAAEGLMLVSLLLIVLGILTPSATGVGGDHRIAGAIAPRGIHRITRHPFLWGVALWAGVHLAANPQPVNLLFFGTFLLVSVAGTFSIDAKLAKRHGAAWVPFAAQTSNLPFAAIVQGRAAMDWAGLGLWRVAAGIAAYGAVLMLHGRLFGAPVLGV